MDVFIAYFDILGFKEFIERNSKSHVDHYFQHVFRESQSALTGGVLKDGPPGIVLPDLDVSRVNCLHISDSILFWTNDQEEHSFIDIAEVCYAFNWRSLQASFPVRGCLVAGDMEFRPFNIQKNGHNTIFINSSMYGEGVIDSYLKAESQDWAGGYIDKTALSRVSQQAIAVLMNEGKVRYHDVPRTKGAPSTREICFSIVKPGFNQLTFDNVSDSLRSTFIRHMNGTPLISAVQHKLDNTINFLAALRDDLPAGLQP